MLYSESAVTGRGDPPACPNPLQVTRCVPEWWDPSSIVVVSEASASAQMNPSKLG